MPLSPGRDLNCSTDSYGHRRTSWPFTFIENAMLPTPGRIDTTVALRASSSCTTSTTRRAEYGCAHTVAVVPDRTTTMTASAARDTPLARRVGEVITGLPAAR